MLYKTDSETRTSRATAALIGVAIGDALGMPSQTLSCAEIVQHYGRIETFIAPYPNHPVSHGLTAGQVTDDTEQTLLLAHRLIEDRGRVDPTVWAQNLKDWEQDVRERGLRDLLGPSTKAAIEAILAGTPADETGRNGTTNGAAMRITPAGIATPPVPLERFISGIETACRMTHNTGEAIAGASAVAMVISLGVDGAGFEQTLDQALDAAAAGQKHGYPTGHQNMSEQIRSALLLAESCHSPEEFAEQVGTSVASHHSVPAAFGIVKMAKGDPWRSAVLAANIGDDTDTIGAISTAMAAACVGMSGFPEAALNTVRRANTLPVEELVPKLLELRDAAGVADKRAG